ncbi:hypothetical protein PPACK8108_LOCUS5498 [Phakopsora pachyrhizi]|uniref:E3 ubiquitin protein ligase n=1 Tax=Phakopsora pachyrhizi TaxID=170000 RepID=A0AAV0APJ0_PHAPC|nr:hypothetical protein PPACK8108_LOCUS5498 [Phakopsora pachyrhizi]
MLEDQRKRRIEAAVGVQNGPTNCKKPMLATSDNLMESKLDHPNERYQEASENRTTLNGHGNECDQLESFRKEALWRQLQEYKRDLRRAQEKLEQSEGQKIDAESRIAAIDICWNQLVEDVRLLFKDSCTQLDASSNPILNSLPSSPTSLDRALQQRSTASKDLIVHLISLASSSSAASPELEEVRSRCRRLTAESATTRAALGLAESKIKQVQDQLEAAEESARRAEKKLDRERSRTVRALDAQGQGGSNSRNANSDQPAHPSPAQPPADASNGDQNGSVISSKEPSMNNSVILTQQEIYQELAEVRSRELEALQAELLRRAHEIDVLQWKMINLPDSIVHETTAYKTLRTQMANATVELDRVRTRLDNAQKDADDLRERQDEFRTAIMSEMKSQIEDMDKRLASRDVEIARIRGTREDTRSEIHELKARDAEKMKQVAQIRTLANSRQERIEALLSEVRRLKMSLAAEAGDRGTVEFLALNEEIEITKGLQESLKKAEATIKDLQSQVEQLSEPSKTGADTKLVSSEAEARAQLAAVQERVVYLEKIFGTEGDPELTQVIEKLKTELDRQKVLEAKLAAQEASASMLYSEVDRLSTAWAILDEQIREKVFKLAEYEDKVLKAVQEKAKADNRYFSAMRLNETMRAQTSALEKMAEKQTATISKISDELRAVTARLTAAEKEITMYQKLVETLRSKISELTVENTDLSARCSQHDQKMGEVVIVLKDRSTQIENEAAARRKAEENMASMEKELGKLKTKLQSTEGVKSMDSAEVVELKSFNEDLTKMLKCNSCKQRFKSHVITRCMHLFCGACLEARLETRQRKCPTCSIAFGTNDVSPVYF